MKICHEFLNNPALAALFSALGSANLYIVGGAVRDAIIGRAVNDIDLATSFVPDEIIGALNKANIRHVPTGIEHGTISAIINKKPYEITTFRRDKETDGRHAKVEFSRNIHDDAMRRDFTINALYCNLNGEVLDPTGQGLDDLAAKKIAFVGIANQRITEDYLRILRLYRFFAQLDGFSIDRDADLACGALAHNIKNLSRERVSAEIMKIACANNCPNALKMMNDNGVLGHAIGEKYELANLQKLWKNQIECQIAPNSIRTLLNILPNHKNCLMDFCKRLRFANIEKNQMIESVKLREFLGANYSIKNLKTAIYKFSRELALDFVLNNIEDCANIYNEIAQFCAPKFPIDGAYLLAKGIKSGPNMGKILNAIENTWLENDFQIDDFEIKQLIAKSGF